MSQQDLLFLVLTLIGVTSLTLWIVHFVRTRRSSGDGRAGWWEGPWEDDDRKK